jgi:structural maintenance of chromosome 1
LQLAKLTTLQLDLSGIQNQLTLQSSGEEVQKQELTVNQLILSDYRNKLKKLTHSLESLRHEQTNILKDKQAITESIQSSDHRLMEITNELQIINEKLRSDGEERRRGKQEQELLEAISTMQVIFKGVHGKLVDLCRPIQKKYAKAVSVAAG